jgi:hypothetical protein
MQRSIRRFVDALHELSEEGYGFGQVDGTRNDLPLPALGNRADSYLLEGIGHHPNRGRVKGRMVVTQLRDERLDLEGWVWSETTREIQTDPLDRYSTRFATHRHEVARLERTFSPEQVADAIHDFLQLWHPILLPPEGEELPWWWKAGRDTDPG